MKKQHADYLLLGGTVIDPVCERSFRADVAVGGGKILAIGADLAYEAAKTLDVSGCYVTPGLIDMHCHCYPTFPFAHDSLPTIHPDAHMFQNGVTTAVDAGTCGWQDFPRMKQELIDRAETRVLAFLNIADGGMVHMDTEDQPTHFHPGVVSEVAKAYADDIVGIKSAHYWVGKPFDATHPAWASIDATIEAAACAGLPCMIDFQPTLPERSYDKLLLEHLRPGDIHTHMYAQQFPVLDDHQHVNGFLFKAHERGIRFDLGHGAGSFWLRNAIPAIAQGHVPDTLSTDLYIDNVAGPVIGLMHVMSKFLCMGLPLERLVAMATTHPAQVLHRPELGTLASGSCADVAVLRIIDGPVHFADSGRARLKGDKRLCCMATFRAGKLVYDPYALSMPDWETAPAPYWVAPGILR